MRNENGTLSLLLGLLLSVIMVAAIGFVLLFKEHRRQVNLQFKLDTCVGKEALALKSTLESIEAGNGRMRAERLAAAVLTVLNPGAMRSLATTLQIEAQAQDLRIEFWKIRGWKWMASLGCGTGSLPGPWPAMHWSRPPPDILGARPLVWTGPPEKSFRIVVRRTGRGSAASVNYDELSKGKWNAKWAAYRTSGKSKRVFGASFP